MDNLAVRLPEANRGQREGLSPVALRRPRAEKAPEAAIEPRPVASAPEAPAGGGAQADNSLAHNLEALKQVTEDLNKYFSGGRGIRFEVSPDTHHVMVQVIDLESEKVIRSIPPERLVSFRDSFREMSSGLLLDNQA